ncbi:hypothetical protein A1O1_00088 [Capronia coronata CBS 617.96]|uniref:Extracellular membrane protein CFEM domain-containing protein n=1 Tax=Capronia coronata CBS 617.96 TaxID=1182541 RepID=W9YZ67_9EURO|nr:uncharacterized protein A1O1_00088 [Capronia coronata CBS 617.96]EXJ94970.1 hypothetical protein A1O1_00088 [Capronia coronata CBS 617.96]
MAVATVIITLLLIALSTTAPTKIVDCKNTDLNYHQLIIKHLCQTQFCLFGEPTFNLDTYTCECPAWEDQPLFNDPCANLECPYGDEEPFYMMLDNECLCKSVKEFKAQIAEAEAALDMEPAVDLVRRQVTTIPEAPVDTAVPTFLPPANPDITPALLNESLTIQPQNTATIGSIIPYFRDNLLQVHMQLNGPVADTLVVNASASLPCGNIGTDPEPNLALVPKVVQQGLGEPQVVVADCLCIAVNMYNPNVVNYWIQKPDGSIYSLTGSNKVLDINKMVTNKSVALDLVALPSGTTKRNPEAMVQYVQPERRQIFRGPCDKPCPFYHMHQLKSSDGFCACMFNAADETINMATRDMTEPDAYNAKMTPEACAAMTCFNGGDRAAVFNPFSLTCWCISPSYLEVNPSAWTPPA